MLLRLYKATQTYSWYDITSEGYDEETGEYFPGSGEETTVFYQYALCPLVLQANDGGQSSRKDGFFIDTIVELVTDLPDGAELRAPNTISTLWNDVRLWLDMRAGWLRFIHQPRRYWIPVRLSSGRWLGSGFTYDISRFSQWLNIWRIRVCRSCSEIWAG